MGERAGLREPCDTPWLERGDATHRPSSPNPPGLLVVRHRVSDRSPTRPAPSVLPPVLSPTRLRTPPRLRPSTHRAAIAWSTTGRFVVRLWLRTWCCCVRQDPRPPHQRARRRVTPGNVVRTAGATGVRLPLHDQRRPVLFELHGSGEIQPVAVRRQPIERARHVALLARRHRRTPHPTHRRTRLDQSQLALMAT